MATVLAFINYKGGVAKTTSAYQPQPSRKERA